MQTRKPFYISSTTVRNAYEYLFQGNLPVSYEVLEANGLLDAIGKLILIQQRALFTNPLNGSGYQYGCSFCQYFHVRYH